ncbi:hypothetical protein BSL78_28763 [Apostichopus japonicus]|uniref:Uncharacterized protein n=1 Tax=Stichopus japonicus TaxID=307972 RepID=A0A2G8JF88_STIJA|nr:hypothetical protein BSL78_28763 [Apostichopus japonicus]
MTDSRESRLKDLDSQLKQAVNICTTSGFNPTKISECAEPVISWVIKKRRRKTLQRLLCLSLVVVIIAILWGNENCYRWVCIGCKLLQLKLLPYWDWTTLYDVSCVISNPYYVVETVTPEDCKWCQQYPDVHRLTNLSHDVMTNEYLLKQLPVIITDAREGQSASENLSFKAFQKMYLEENVYRDCLSCRFVSSIGSSSMADFLKSISESGSFNAHWFNCQFKCMKAFRKFYQRPYFIPPMVGSSDENFVLVGQEEKTENDGDYISTAQSFMRSDSIAWLTQITGQFHITLHSECGCRTMEETLQEGDTLAYTSKTWWFTYQAVGEGEVIAIGSSGDWD